MQKYDGRLIYQMQDEHGLLEIVEADGVRSLHFGSYARQSSMRLAEPDKLELSYIRAMTSWLLFKPDFKEHGLMIGLGAGSLTKYLLHHFLYCKIRVVEYREQVVKLARDYFELPFNNRLKITIADAGEYIHKAKISNPKYYSLLFVDAFDHEGIAVSICQNEFFRACRDVLKKDGIFVMNCWGGLQNPLFQMVFHWLADVFDDRVLYLPVAGRGNIILLGFNNDFPAQILKDLKERANYLQQYYMIDFTIFLRDIKRYNLGSFNRIVQS